MVGDNLGAERDTGETTLTDDNPRERKRRRGAQACDVCRSRKVRCDREQPCQNCVTTQTECTYGSESLTKGKTDQILDGIQRVEAQLDEIRLALSVSISARNEPVPPQQETMITTAASTERKSETVPVDQQQQEDDWTNAVLSAQHISSTESLLQWECFDAFPGVRRNKRPIFLLEQQRPPIEEYSTEDVPRLTSQEIRDILDDYRRTVNFAYPILNIEEIEGIENQLLNSPLDKSVPWCRAWLVMALGCASQSTTYVSEESIGNEDAILRSRALAGFYYSLFLEQSYLVHNDISVIATQCLLFSALYFAYLQRPLQAWSYINMTATRCKCLLFYANTSTTLETECLRRIFWSCYILESDYLAELAALPQSGVGDIESTIPLPAEYHTARLVSEQELSSLYFLACIAMRRLLNRVHNLLYAPNTGVGLDDSRFPQIVRELDHQLEQWRTYLPHAFAFTIDTQPVENEYGGFLRQRYLACRSVIYRPFLTQALHDDCDEYTLSQSEVCLDACILHITNLRPYKHTVLIDTWICSLSMASAMLVLLAASQRPQLRDHLTARIKGLGLYLVRLIEPWMRLPGDAWSPSVKQSLDLIREVELYIEQS